MLETSFFAGNTWGQRQLDGNWQRILVTGRALAIWFQSFRLGACNSAVTSAWCWQQKLQEKNHLPAIWQPFESGKTTEEMTRVKQHLKPVAEFISKTRSSRVCLRWQDLDSQVSTLPESGKSGRSLGPGFFSVSFFVFFSGAEQRSKSLAQTAVDPKCLRTEFHVGK